jgi:repressor LexA
MALRKKGVLRQADKRSRTMEVIKPLGGEDTEEVVEVPILGSVAAGIPILSEENYEGKVSLHKSMVKKNKSYFAVKVKGDSMLGAGIFSGDMAIIEKTEAVRNGEIAVIVVDDDSYTIKRFYRERFRVKLQSENPDYPPIYSQNVRILGRLARLYRAY